MSVEQSRGLVFEPVSDRRHASSVGDADAAAVEFEQCFDAFRVFVLRRSECSGDLAGTSDERLGLARLTGIEKSAGCLRSERKLALPD